MRTVAYPALFAAIALAACGGGSSGTVLDSGRPGPGEEGGVPGTRGGGTPLPGGDGAAPPDGGAPDVSTPDVRPDAPPDRAADLAAPDVPVDRPPDLMSPPPDSSADICATGGLCESYEEEYTRALARARQCNPTIKGQCAQTRPNSLRCAGCSVWITSPLELDNLRAKHTDAGCLKCRRICPLIACPAPTMGECRLIRAVAPPEDPPDRIIPPIGVGYCYDATDGTPVSP
jgi:hypothetical protein